ncbi:mediated genome instability rmi1 [Paramyrothecium foliicola]|nr:mediated genome instability rmi1 [Paramyrothecium foliicola]
MDLVAQLRASLLAQSLPAPSSNFLASLITARNPPPPMPSLLATAKARILASDLTAASSGNDGGGAAPLDPSLPSLPAGVDDPSVQELRLPHGVHVQVIDVENLSLSRWEQVEELEAIERGERTRGREVIRVVNTDQDDPAAAAAGGSQTQRPQSQAPAAADALRAAGRNATHRLVLQDCRGQRVFATELKRIDRIGVGSTNMGEKVLLKAGTVVARGVVLLTPETCVLLGGKVDAWQKSWVEGRLARLKEAAGSDRPQSHT